MAIDFTVGNNVIINRAYVEQILPSVVGITLQTTVSLGYIGANPSEVLETGSIVVSPSVTLSFIRVRPRDTSNPAYQRADGVIVYFPSDATLNNSFELSTSYIDDKQFVIALNSTGSTITKGQFVRQTGFDVTQQVPIIALADAATVANSAVLGLVAADILTTELGSVILTGAFEGLNTGSFSSVGSKVFLSDTPGAIATSAGTVETVVGRALSVDATNGSISLVQSLGGGGGGSGGTTLIYARYQLGLVHDLTSGSIVEVAFLSGDEVENTGSGFTLVSNRIRVDAAAAGSLIRVEAQARITDTIGGRPWPWINVRVRGLPTRMGHTQEGVDVEIDPNLSTVANHGHKSLIPISTSGGQRLFNFGGTYRLSLNDEIFLEVFQDNVLSQTLRVESTDTWLTVRVVG